MAAYYNEFNPRMAEWLRGLIADGLIAPGEVDSRSILEVQPDDLKGFTQCHFFAGLGGWSYALRIAGFPDDRPVWTGSCPCQPFSAAGKRKGFDDERHLWPAWYRLIAERRPAKVFGEQVARVPEWLRLVRGDLETLGLAVGAIPLEAASAGAYHFRERFYFFGVDLRRREGLPQSEVWSGRATVTGADGAIEPMGYTEGVGRERWQDEKDQGRRERAYSDSGKGIDSSPVADSASTGPHAAALPGIRRGEAGAGSRDGESKRYSGAFDMADADRSGLEKRLLGEGEQSDSREQGSTAFDGGGRGEALADPKRGGREYVEVQGPRDLFAPDAGAGESWNQSGTNDAGLSSRLGWAIGSDGKARPVAPGIRLLAHAVSGRLAIQRPVKSTKTENGEENTETHWYSRAQAIEGFGNAIDPICASQFITAAEAAIQDLMNSPPA